MAKTNCSPDRLRMRVVFKPMYSTVPMWVSTMMKSPITKGLSSRMDSDAKMSPRMFWSAMATAMPPMPKLATRVVILTPGTLSRARRAAMANRAVRPTKVKARSVVMRSPASCTYFF